HLRGRCVDERRKARHGDGLLKRRDNQRKGDDGVLTYQQLDVRRRDGGEPRQLRLDLVRARTDVHETILTTVVGDPDELTARRDLDRRDRHARQHRLGFIGDCPGDRRGCLSERRGRKYEQREYQCESTHHRVTLSTAALPRDRRRTGFWFD